MDVGNRRFRFCQPDPDSHVWTARIPPVGKREEAI